MSTHNAMACPTEARVATTLLGGRKTNPLTLLDL